MTRIDARQSRVRLVYVEAVDTNSIDEIETPHDMLTVGARLAEERGTASAMIARADTGEVLTPEGFSDVAFDVSGDAGVAAAARALEASCRGEQVGTDYVVHHWPGAQEQDPEHFESLVPAWPLPFVGEHDDKWARVASPGPALCDVCDVRVSPDGSRTVWLEAFPGWSSGYGVWVQEHATGARRMVTRLQGAAAVLGDLSLSLDGRWLLANSPQTDLVDLDTGHTARFGGEIRAACWYQFAGPSAVLVAVGDRDHPSELRVLDLAAFSWTPLAQADRRIDGLDAAPDGSIAARFHGAPDWTDSVVVSDDGGRTFEPVASSHGASGWRRRTTRPRWVHPVPDSADAAGAVQLEPQFEEFLRSNPPARHVTEDEASLLVSKCIARMGRALQQLDHTTAPVALAAEVRAVAEIFAVLDRPRLRKMVDELTPPLMRAAAHHDGGMLRSLLAEVVALGHLGEQPESEPARLVFQRGDDR